MRAIALAAGLLFASVPAAVLAADAPAADYPHGKLPDTAKPLSYRMTLTIIPSQPRFSGHVEIDVRLKGETSSLFMHGRDLKVKTATAILPDGKTIKAKYTQLDATGVVRLDFAKPVSGIVTLSFDYDAAFADGPAGLYHLKVGDDWYVWSQFESTDARAAFPCFDEPGYKTPFKVSIISTPGMVVASNAPSGGGGMEGKMMQTDFYRTELLPTYLVALAVGPFAVEQTVVPPSAVRPNP
ncbi:MAG: M1 family peptidase, partial [Asticcacaulis sp.]|nr:M1 family peptidase [Asticcacaulis sp.]